MAQVGGAILLIATQKAERALSGRELVAGVQKLEIEFGPSFFGLRTDRQPPKDRDQIIWTFGNGSGSRPPSHHARDIEIRLSDCDRRFHRLPSKPELNSLHP